MIEFIKFVCLLPLKEARIEIAATVSKKVYLFHIWLASDILGKFLVHAHCCKKEMTDWCYAWFYVTSIGSRKDRRGINLPDFQY